MYNIRKKSFKVDNMKFIWVNVGLYLINPNIVLLKLADLLILVIDLLIISKKRGYIFLNKDYEEERESN